jgi:transcriptional regulator with XRE-family HTH domain
VKSLQEWLSQQGVGTRLRALRVQAGLTGKALADANGWAQSKVSRIEKGEQRASADDIRAWGRTAGADDLTVAELLQLAEEARVVNATFGNRMRNGQAAVQATYTDLARNATLIRHFEMTFVPGPLQVPEYTRRILTEMRDLHGKPKDDIPEAVAERAKRYQMLYEPGRRWEFLLAEPVLRWVLPPPAVMRVQLDRLQTVIGLEHIRFGIIPMGRPLAWSPQNTVEIYVGEETVAAAETFIGETFHRDEEAAFYGRALDLMWSEAVEGDDARELITRAARALEDAN